MIEDVHRALLEALCEGRLRSGARDSLSTRDALTLAQFAAGDLRVLRAQVERLQAKLDTLARFDPDAPPAGR